MVKSMITLDMVNIGYKNEFISLIKSPNDDGIVCKIGDNWFYFGGFTAEECDTVEEYKKIVPEESIVREIYEVLDEDIRDLDEDEYLYYYLHLRECGIR